MIYEFALEPELVATWVDRKVGRYFIAKFGVGECRLASRYPKRWAKLVWEAFEPTDDLARTRMTELLARLTERMVQRRGHVWSPESAWLQNAETEHARVPFQAILARVNERGHPAVLVAEEIDDETPSWTVDRGREVVRRAADMSAALANMLKVAEVIVLVDPHFGPENGRHRRPLKAFLEVAVQNRPGDPPKRVLVLSSADNGRTEAFFQGECAATLPGWIPSGVRVEFIRLREKDGGERLHNRYILTDVGGVMFGVGLDEGQLGDSDDLVVLNRRQYELRWRQYVDDGSGFERPEATVIVDGSA